MRCIQYRERFLADLDAALRGTGVYESEYRKLIPDGSVIWLYDKGRMVFDASGTPEGCSAWRSTLRLANS